MAQNNKTTIMFYEICRLCLEERGYCDIFERDGLSKDIYKCTEVKVTLSDNLPQRICKNCLETVCKAAELRKIAKKNEYHLQLLFADEPRKASTQDMMETVTSRHFENVNPNQEPISAIENFLTVRTDLFEASVTEQSIMSKLEPISQQLSPQKPEILNKLIKVDDNTEYKCSQSILSKEETTSQEPSSQKPEIIRLINEDGNTEYKCNKCPKKFDKWKKLYLHNRLHDKKHNCPLDGCGKKFSTKGDVEKHIRTHTGEKPFQCDMCDKSFAQRGTLKSHKETIHNVERYIVDIRSAK